MVEFIKGKLLTGPAVAILGSVMLLIGGILGISLPEMQLVMALFPILYVTFVLPIILGLIGIAGAVLMIIKKEYMNYLIIIVFVVVVILVFN